MYFWKVGPRVDEFIADMGVNKHKIQSDQLSGRKKRYREGSGTIDESAEFWHPDYFVNN